MNLALISKKPEVAAQPDAKAAVKSLRIGEPKDSFEREADLAADAVTSGGAQTELGWSLSRVGIGAGLPRTADGSGEVHSASPPLVTDALRSPGQPLDRNTRQYFERRFQHNLAAVRVHDDDISARSAKAVGAHAYTVNNDVVFAKGRYRPNDSPGRRLLAHELAHTIQQENGAGGLLQRDKDGAAEPLRGYVGGGEGVRKGMKTTAMPEVQQAPGRVKAAASPTLSANDRALIAEAEAANARLGKPLVVKTKSAAEEGDVVRSGFGKRGGGPERTQEVLDVAKEIGHKLATNESLDSGVPGQEKASHAEKLAAIDNPGKPLAVDRAMCDDCFAFFQKLARARGETLVVHEPGNTWVFRPDGTRVGIAPGAQVVIHGDGRGASAGPDAAPEGPGSSPPAAAGEPPAGGTPPGEAAAEGALKGAPGTPDVAPAAAGAGAKAAAEGVAETATKAAVTEGVTDAAAGGAIAGSIAGAALKFVAEQAILIAVTLAAQWASAKFFEAALDADIDTILKPAIIDRMGKLQPQLVKLQGTRKLFVRITYDFVYQRDSPDNDPVREFMQPAPPFYEFGSVRLVNIHPGNEELDFASSSSETRETLLPGRERVTTRSSYSVLLDDAPKRKRAAESAAALEKLKKAAKTAPAQPAAPQPPPQAAGPGLLPSPGPDQTPAQFVPIPGAPPRPSGPQPQDIVANTKAGLMPLLARGEKLVSTGSSAQADIEAFKRDEDNWRSLGTINFNYFKDNGPDQARGQMDELLNADNYGGRLKQIRHTFGD